MTWMWAYKHERPNMVLGGSTEIFSSWQTSFLVRHSLPKTRALFTNYQCRSHASNEGYLDLFSFEEKYFVVITFPFFLNGKAGLKDAKPFNEAIRGLSFSLYKIATSSVLI